MGLHASRSTLVTLLTLTPALLAGLHGSTFAQTPTFPDSLKGESLVLKTERFSSTHNASLELDYGVDDSSFTGLFRAHLLSSTTLFGENSTREQADLLADLQYNLEMPVNLFVLFEGTMTGEAGEIGLIPGIDNTAATFLGLGGRSVDDEGNHLGVAVGGAYNRQLNTEDAGAAIYVDGAGKTDIDGYLLALDGTARWYNTAPRLNGNIEINGSFDRQFEEGVYFAIAGSWGSIANDLYIKRREEDILLFGGVNFDGIKKRRERRLQVNSFLYYPISESLSVTGDLSLNTDAVARWESEEGLPPLPREADPYTFDQQESAVGGSLGIEYYAPTIQANTRLSIRSSDQQNIVDPIGEVPEIELRRRRSTSAINDYRTNLISLDGAIVGNLGVHDTVGLNGSVSIYRYDTPDTANTFDKDEASITAGFTYGRRFSSLTSLELEGQVYLTHLVYLFGENSIDNNWNRILRLAPSVVYEVPDLLTNRMTSELIANYTNYDFQGTDAEIRGRSFRELRLRDSLVVLIGRKVGVMARGEVRIAERGSFSWRDFAESLIERSRTELLEFELFHGRDTATLWGIGGKLARVRSFQTGPRGELEPFSDRTSLGPTAHLVLPTGSSTRLVATGWWEFQFDESQLTNRVPWAFLTLEVGL